MNLGQLRSQLETELQYAPDLATWRSDSRHAINRAYQQLATLRKWPWLWTETPMWVMPDLTIASGAGGVTQVAGNGPRIFTVTWSALYTALGFTSATDARDLTQYLQGLLVGAQFDLASGDRTVGPVGANWQRAPFAIEYAVLQDPRVPPTTVNFWLDPRASISALSGSEGSFKFSFPRIRLPTDIDQLIAVRDDKDQPLPALTPSEARRFIRNGSVPQGTNPAYVLEDGGMAMQYPQDLVAANNDGGAQYDHTPFMFQRENWPLRETIALGDASGIPGTMTPGTKCKVFACWYYSGRFGPPSNVAEFTVTGNSVRVSGLPVLPQTTGNFEYGRRVAIFMAEGEGAFFFRGTVLTATATTYNITTSNSNVTTQDVGLRLPRWDELYPGGVYQYLRLLPRVTGPKRYTLEYRRKARQLIEDTDSPEFPEQYHELLVWLAAVDLEVRFGQNKTTPLFASNANRILAALNAQFMPSERYSSVQKGMIGTPDYTKPTQTVDWHGDR